MTVVCAMCDQRIYDDLLTGGLHAGNMDALSFFIRAYIGIFFLFSIFCAFLCFASSKSYHGRFVRVDHACTGVSYRQLGISRKGDVVLVLSDLVEISAHRDILVRVIRVDVPRINIGRLLVVFDFGVLACTRLLALHMRVASVWKLAFFVSAITCLGVVGTLDNMTLVTVDALLAIAKQSKGTTDKRTG